MDRQRLQLHLAQAHRHVALGLRHIEQQKRLIIRLEQAGCETKQAEDLLAVFYMTQQSHEHGRDRIIKELDVTK
jgi:hypothetical protein